MAANQETRSMEAGDGEKLRFTNAMLARPALAFGDVVASLEHFAIISYAVSPERVRPHVHPRFDLDCFDGADGTPRVWVSVVPFEDQDFRLAGVGWPKFRFGQTNYRTYVVDRQTGQRAVWFFGTTLDSWLVTVPRHLWKLPWHRGTVRFSCTFDVDQNRYTRYRMVTESAWAPVEVEIEDTGRPVSALDGYRDLEAGLVALTHPLMGVYYRRDGQLGTYRIWHDRLQCTSGRLVEAKFDLLDRLGIATFAEQATPHSVLLQRRTEFTIYLPPKRLVGGIAAQRLRKARLVERALDEFRRTRGAAPMGAHVLKLDDVEAIVRVMYIADHLPPGRAWFAVPSAGGPVRELAFEHVASLESPWR
jgi:hypothetical protein